MLGRNHDSHFQPKLLISCKYFHQNFTYINTVPQTSSSNMSISPVWKLLKSDHWLSQTQMKVYLQLKLPFFVWIYTLFSIPIRKQKRKQKTGNNLLLTSRNSSLSFPALPQSYNSSTPCDPVSKESFLQSEGHYVSTTSVKCWLNLVRK